MIKRDRLRQLEEDYEGKKVQITNKVQQKIKEDSIVKVAERARVRSNFSSKASSKNASALCSPKNKSKRQVMTNGNNSRDTSKAR